MGTLDGAWEQLRNFRPSVLRSRLRHLWGYVLAAVSVSIALGASLFFQHFRLHVPGIVLLLFAVAISSWYGGTGPAVLAVFLSTISFYWYFVEPVRTIYVYWSDVPYFVIFVAFAVLISWFGTVRRRAERDLRKQAALLDLTHDTVFVMDMEGVIEFWNQGAEKQYGWTVEQATGKVAHNLLKTVFPAPLDDIKAEVRRTGRWEGELVHTKKDGTPVVAASRWALRRNERRVPVGILETNSDITERKRAEEALQRSEAYLAEGQRLAHTGSWAFDVASKSYLHISEECSRIFEMDPQESPSSREAISRLIHPDDLDKVQAEFDKLLREKVDTSSEFRIVLPSGATKRVQTIRHPVLNEAGEAAKIVGTVVDVTERKRAEEALRASEAYLTEAQELTHTGSWALDAASREYTYWSDEMFRIFGVDPQNGIPARETMNRRIHPDDEQRANAGFEKSLREKVDTSDEYRFVLPDGTVKHIQSIRHPRLNDAGDVVQLVGSFVDITERKASEQALRESETRFRTFVDHAADAFFMLSFDRGTIIDANRSACESLGYTREELIGRTPAVFDVSMDRTTSESREEGAGESECFDRHWHQRKDGSLFPVEVETSEFWHGGRRFLLKVACDVSDRVRAEEERERLRELEAELAHINRVSMMGELATSIAHEVNQPLSGVVSNGSACLRWLAADAPNVEEAREAARRIVRDGKRAAEVIARIRALAKRTAAPKEELDLNEAIREILSLVGDEAKRTGVSIRVQLADSVWPIFGDRVQLQQVLLNLIMNGIEAMRGPGEPVRELVINTRNGDSDEVHVTVEDSGTGLDPGTMERIFEPFYTTKPGGMGMGLSVSRSILQAHGGQLWATARDGPGTIFHFTVPKHKEEQSNARVAGA